jgi:MoxR-like ATPase
MILADEINRASPKSQSALLEAMEERQVTAEGETRPLPEPFFVIATQNPAHQIGTFPLPESQLDRFLLRIQLGYPDSIAERQLLRGQDRREMIAEISPCMSLEELIALQRLVPNIHVSEALLAYVQALIQHTRTSNRYASGLSPRAGLALLRAAQSWAMISARGHVLPEDVQAVLGHVVGHRLYFAGERAGGVQADPTTDLLQAVPVP